MSLNAQRSTLNKERDWSTWTPDPQRALWLALVIPGGGQIYNRKYWKLPLVYGGFMGCIYAMRWNNMMYKDYAQAYLDIMDDDPGTASYNKFLHLGRQITPANEDTIGFPQTSNMAWLHSLYIANYPERNTLDPRFH